MAPTIPVYTLDLTGEVYGRGVHGVLEHRWDQDTWGVFTPITISDDPGQIFATTVVTGTGIITGAVTGHGNHRVAYARQGTEWADSEITSIITPPTPFATTNAQVGHIHRVRQVSPGLYEGIAVWTAIVGGDYGLLNCRPVRWDGSTLFQGGGDLADASDSMDIDRTLQVMARQRLNFGSWINEYKCAPYHLNGMRIGDIVTVSSMDNSSFDLTNVQIANLNRAGGTIQITNVPTTGTVAWATTPTGQIQPSSTDSQKRWAPFWMSTRVIGGTSSAVTVQIKRWRLNEGEPPWSSRNIQRHIVIPGGSVPTVATEAGSCALWAAHFNGGSSGGWGDVYFRKLN